MTCDYCKLKATYDFTVIRYNAEPVQIHTCDKHKWAGLSRQQLIGSFEGFRSRWSNWHCGEKVIKNI